MNRRSETAAAIAGRLREVAAVIGTVSDVTYATSAHADVSGSMGAHVRHLLDHARAIVDRPSGAVIDYDSRHRGTDVERIRRVAALELSRLASRLEEWVEEVEDEAVEVSTVITVAGDRRVSVSTVGRELAFVLSHTVHHQAIIALLLASVGQETPERFGVAPSTPQRLSCARSA